MGLRGSVLRTLKELEVVAMGLIFTKKEERRKIETIY
jgi:hypothetical protein